MKKSLVMASLLALGTSVMAVEVQPFVGAGIGVKFQIMFPPVSHLCFHFFKQVLRV